MRILLIDNYDSFTYNIAHLFSELACEVDVLRNDDPTLDPEQLQRWPLIVIGPGPGRPADAGITPRAIATAVRERLPIFGVCLGQQALGEHFGGTVVHAPKQMHGKVSEITHIGTGIFAGLPQRFPATRYHSLCIDPDTMPAELVVTARSDDGVIQGIAHRTLPIHAVQFHPESILTTAGRQIAENMLKMTTGVTP
jgi:anthranilate synthase component 2